MNYFTLYPFHVAVLDNESDIQGATRKRELLNTPIRIEEIQEKKFIDRNLHALQNATESHSAEHAKHTG